MVNPMTYARFAAQSAGQVAKVVGNTTSTSPAPAQGQGGGQSRGTQVEYLATDGSAYRVSPGSASVQEGRWQVRDTPGQGSGRQVCSRYPMAAGAAATMQSDSWHCVDAAQWAREHNDMRPGDPLGLGTAKTVPAPLPATQDFTVASGAELWHRDAGTGAN